MSQQTLGAGALSPSLVFLESQNWSTDAPEEDHLLMASPGMAAFQSPANSICWYFVKTWLGDSFFSDNISEVLYVALFAGGE